MNEIPCELCGLMIPFASYNEHTRTCGRPYILYRDEEENQIYRLDLAEAFAMFARIGNIANPIQLMAMVNAEYSSNENTEFVDLQSEVIGQIYIGLNDQDKEACLVDFQENNEEQLCPICLDILNKNKEAAQTLCKHSYCKMCINEWFKNHKTCPMCNANQQDLVAQNWTLKPS
jgi:E3 ubiquitin-protein ligase SHPRH